MHFDEAVQYLLSLGHETLTIKLGLKNTELLLQELQNPERAFFSVQIAGTNGKGSTAVMLESICRSAGIRTGLFTSPHLASITERVKIAGVDLSREEFAAHATTVRAASYRLVETVQLEALPTFFEQVTAIALVAFRHSEIELAILETGLGGRLDSTTAASAQVCGITQIAFDHEEYLGDTIESIAAEKAAIIRPSVKAVIAQQSPEALAVILQRCEEVGVTPLIGSWAATVNEVSVDGRFRVTFETTSDRYDRVWIGLRGRHQIGNATVSISLAEVLRADGFQIDRSAIVKGIETANHPGRLELISGESLVLLDGAHNPAGARALREYLTKFAQRPLILVFGAMRDKRFEQIADELFPIADELILTPIQNPRTATSDALLEITQRFAVKPVSLAASSNEALDLALDKTTKSGMVCVTGSLYLIGEVRERVLQKNNSDLRSAQQRTT